MDVARTEGSLLASLGELRAIEQQRLAEERAAIEAAAQAARHAQDAAERLARETEAAKLAAERNARMAAEQARADAEREARMRIEAAEAAERARHLVVLDRQRLAEDIAVRREAAIRQRPRWMIAVTGFAVVAAIAMGWLAVGRGREADAARRDRDRAILDRAIAQQDARGADAARVVMARELAELGAKVRAAIDRVNAAQDDADRRAVREDLRRLEQQRAVREDENRRRDEDRARKERDGGVAIPPACLHVAVCKQGL